MKDVNVELADTREALAEMSFRREKLMEDMNELTNQLVEKEDQLDELSQNEAQLRNENKTLKLALQACQERIRLYDATVTGLRLTLEGLATATKGQ